MHVNRILPLLIALVTMFASSEASTETSQKQKGKEKATIQTKGGDPGIQMQKYQGSAIMDCGSQQVRAGGDTIDVCESNLTQAMAATNCPTYASRQACTGSGYSGPHTASGGGGVVGTLSGPTPEEPSVYSNGCGSRGAKPVVQALENVVADVMDVQSLTGVVFHIAVLPACDLHDSGYVGAVVWDRLTDPNNPTARDYRTWSRKSVDNQLKADIQKLCERSIPSVAVAARKLCKTKATSYYDLVRSHGGSNFDADPTVAGIQPTGPRIND